MQQLGNAVKLEKKTDSQGRVEATHARENNTPVCPSDVISTAWSISFNTTASPVGNDLGNTHIELLPFPVTPYGAQGRLNPQKKLHLLGACVRRHKHVPYCKPILLEQV